MVLVVGRGMAGMGGGVRLFFLFFFPLSVFLDAGLGRARL